MVERDDPWGWGRSLEWATSSPPPRHNFVFIPRVRSESPAFDLHHPTGRGDRAGSQRGRPAGTVRGCTQHGGSRGAPSGSRRRRQRGRQRPTMTAEARRRIGPGVTSSVLWVSRLDRSIEFYRDVFSCTVSVREPGAALLLAPDGFQLYLVDRGTRAEHPSGGIGHQFLIWAVGSDSELRDLAESPQRSWRTPRRVHQWRSFLPDRARPRWHPDRRGPPQPGDVSARSHRRSALHLTRCTAEPTALPPGLPIVGNRGPRT